MSDLEKGKLGIKAVIGIIITTVGIAVTLIVSDRLAAKDIESLNRRVTTLEETTKNSSEAIIRIDQNLQILLPNYKK